MTLIDLARRLACRPRSRPITTIVLHGTAGSTASGAISWLRHIGLSYHTVVAGPRDREGDGAAIKCVADTMVAYHAGISSGPEGSGVNAYSLGLAVVNPEDGRTPITTAQWDTAVARCAQWARAYPTIRWVTTHAIVSPGRKTDPRGPVAHIPGSMPFPIDQFAAEVSRIAGRTIEPWRPR